MYLTLFYVKKGTAKDNDSTSVNTCSTAEKGRRAHSAETRSCGDQKLKQHCPDRPYFYTPPQYASKKQQLWPKTVSVKGSNAALGDMATLQVQRVARKPAVVKGAHRSSHHKNSINYLGCVAEGRQTEGRGWVQSTSSRLPKLHSNQAEASAGAAQFISR